MTERFEDLLNNSIIFNKDLGGGSQQISRSIPLLSKITVELEYSQDSLITNLLKLSKREKAYLGSRNFIGKIIDLHGMQVNEAGFALTKFINLCLRNRVEYIKINHGKGIHTNGSPVLKNMVYNWLISLQEVKGFCSSHTTKGGSGCMDVRLNI